MSDLPDALCLCGLSCARVGEGLPAIIGFSRMQCSAQQRYGDPPPKGGIVARWDFGSAAQGFVLEQISGSHDRIAGISRPTISPVGPALQMDGYSTAIRHTSLEAIARGNDSSISCWLQLEAYPWNELPILD